MEDNKNIQLNISESTSMKGLLILLIVIGHNQILVPHNSGVFAWLYMFHVICFFILPFFYGGKEKELTGSYIGTLITRNWWPYLITALLVWLTAGLNVNLETIYAFFNGSTAMTSSKLGGTFLWFMPTFCSFSILLLFSNKYSWFREAITIMGLGLWFLTWYQFEMIKLYSLFGLPMAIKCFAVGEISKLLFKMEKVTLYIGSIVFVGMSLLFLIFKIILPYSVILFPISAFCLLVAVKSLLQNSFFYTLGRFSFVIYLVHLFVYRGLNLLMQPILLNGIINLLITLIISILVAYIIDRTSILRKFYTPRNFKELITFYKK